MSKLLTNRQVADMLGITEAAVQVRKIQDPHLVPKMTVDKDGLRRFRIEDVLNFIQDRRVVSTWGLTREEAAAYLGYSDIQRLYDAARRLGIRSARHRAGTRFYNFTQDLDAWAKAVGRTKQEKD